MYPIFSTDSTFAPVNGTVGSLVATDGMDLTVVPGSLGLPGPCTLEDLSSNVWNPTRFVLTDEDGIQYTVNQGTGIESIRDLDGNVLTVTTDGLKHSSGKNVTFKRDSQGRITQVTDPNGKVMTYSYDALGNLATFSNAVVDTQKYAYDDNHNMLAVPHCAIYAGRQVLWWRHARTRGQGGELEGVGDLLQEVADVSIGCGR